MVRNVVVPTVTVFTPEAGKANGTAVIVAPGGAFHFLMVDYEGYAVARWLNELGVAAFVLKYRVAHTPENDADMPAFSETLIGRIPRPDPTSTEPMHVDIPGLEEARLLAEEDGRQAVRFVREQGHQWGIDRHRIGIVGFSAGGAVVMGSALAGDTEGRADFAAPVYPGHRPGLAVPADAPPLFIVIADDDELLSPFMSVQLWEAWHKAERPVELHVFGSGGHGFGMNKLDRLSDQWTENFRNWMKAQGVLPA